MKQATAILAGLLIVTFMSVPALAQNEGDYRTRASGDWNRAQNWERFDGAAWRAIGAPPAGSEVITVLQGDSIFVNTDVTITGRLVNQGRVAEDGQLTIGNGGVYQHDRDSGTLPEATWADGSTLHITGVTATAPADRNQPYHHIIFDTPGLLANVNMNLDDVVIGGDIIVRDTGSGRWYLTTAGANEGATVTILGDVVVENGNFSVHGTGNVGTTFVIDHYGNVVVTGGNFSISRGSQPLGTTSWILHEGDFTMENGTTQNSTNPPENARFIFASGDMQRLALGGGNTLSALPIEVTQGTTLDMGASVLAGSGPFFLREGAILGTALPGGVAAIFDDVVGMVTLEDGSGFLFNGSVPQVTSQMMPQVVEELIINNPETVTLSQETTLTGVLRLQAGVFDNTIPLELGPNATVSHEGGTALFQVSSEDGAGVATSFHVDQNYPNPFVSSTAVSFTLPAPSQVTVKVYNVLGQEVLTALDGASLTGGEHQVSLELDGLSAGVYLYRVQTTFGTTTRRMLLVP